MKPRTSRWLINSCTLLLTVGFGLSALSKASALNEFTNTIAYSQLVPEGLSLIAAAIVVAAEFAVAIGLLVGLLKPSVIEPVSRLAMLLGSIFVAYSAWRWMEGIHVPCHCYGRLLNLEPYQSMLLALGLMGASAVLLRNTISSSRSVQVQNAA